MKRVMKVRKYTWIVMAALLLISCGGSSEKKTATPSMDGVVHITTYDSQKFDADIYEAKEGLVKIEYLLNGFQSHTLVIEGMENDFKLEVGDEKTALGEIELKAGRYILYCDIAGHRTSGMEAKLLVS